MWHIKGRGDVLTVVLWGNLKEVEHLEETDLDGNKILK